jgi:GxxExxY protein
MARAASSSIKPDSLKTLQHIDLKEPFFDLPLLCVFASLREPLSADASLQTNPMNENQIAKEVVDAAIKVHSKLGPGLLESVYEVVLARELERRGMRVERQVSIPIEYKGLQFDEGFRADIIIEDKVILELKSVEQLAKVHHKQVFTYLKLADKRLGFLLNFGTDLMKDGIRRIANGMPDSP